MGLNIEKSVFLWDAIGAAFSASVMYFIVMKMPEIFGLKPKIALMLAIIPCFFFAFSVCSHFGLNDSRKKYRNLKILIFLNLSYAFLSFLVIVFNFPTYMESNKLTWVGFSYLVTEIAVILCIVWYEYKILLQIKEDV